MSRFLFYTRDAFEPPPPAPSCGGRLQVQLWRPRSGGRVHRDFPRLPLAAYRLCHHLHLFRNRDLTVLTLSQNRRLVHYGAAYPGSFRFPFMDRADLQIGLLWTHPEYRGAGLATRGVWTLTQALRKRGRTFWYVVSPHNQASIQLARKSGFRLLGWGHKRPVGKVLPLQAYYLEQTKRTTRAA